MPLKLTIQPQCISQQYNTLDANNYTDPNLQLSVSTNKLDQMAKLLEATQQMMKYFKVNQQTPKHTISKEWYQNKYQNKSGTSPFDTCRHKPYQHRDYHKEEVNKITSDTGIPKNTSTKSDGTANNTDIDSLDSPVDSSLDSKWLSKEHEVIEVKLSNSKFAVNFPVKVNNNKTISLFDTGASISCMSKSCFDK